MPSHNIHENADKKKYCNNPAIKAHATCNVHYNIALSTVYMLSHTLFCFAVLIELTNKHKPIASANDRLKWMILLVSWNMEFLKSSNMCIIIKYSWNQYHNTHHNYRWKTIITYNFVFSNKCDRILENQPSWHIWHIKYLVLKSSHWI